MELRKRIPAVQGPVFLLSSAMIFSIAAVALQPAPGSAPSTALQEPQRPQSVPGAQQPGNSNLAHSHQVVAKSVVITGTITRSCSDLSLRGVNGNIYQLDAQDKAAPFEGKFVRVTGTLEASAKLLHVDAIKEATV